MTRNTLLFVSALLAIVAGLAVSYFPPPQNSAAIWSIVVVFFGYAIKDLFTPADTTPAPVVNVTNVTPATDPVPPAPLSPPTV